VQREGKVQEPPITHEELMELLLLSVNVLLVGITYFLLSISDKLDKCEKKK